MGWPGLGVGPTPGCGVGIGVGIAVTEPPVITPVGCGTGMKPVVLVSGGNWQSGVLQQIGSLGSGFNVQPGASDGYCAHL